MSAYALPGLLFPPLPSCFDTYGSSNNNKNISNHYHHSTNVYHHHHDSQDRINVDASFRNQWNDSSFSSTTSRTMSSKVEQNAVPQMSIVDAKIDAIRLIQSFVDTSSFSSLTTTATTHPSTRRQPQHSSSSNATMDHRTNDFYHSCMIFTFQIVPMPSDGTSHATTTIISRTLLQILQCNDRFQTTTNSNDILNLRQRLYADEAAPLVHSHPNSTGHRSFSYLQDQIRLYTPIVEQWIQSVTKTISLQHHQPQSPLPPQQLPLESTTTIRQIWNEFVVVDDPFQVESVSTVIPTTSMYEPSSILIRSSRRRHAPYQSHHVKKSSGSYRRIIPRRIVSMESIDEEEDKMMMDVSSVERLIEH